MADGKSDVYKRQPLGQMYGYRLKGIYTVDDFTYDAAQQKYIVKDGDVYKRQVSKHVSLGYL